MEKKKYIVYYNDEVNEPADVFSADTLEECKHWIDLQLEVKIPVDEDGKSKDKAVNIPATNILRRDHFTTDYIVGTAIVCDADMIE